jgi:hypothetical protein
MTVYRPPHQLGSPDTTVPKFNYVPSSAGQANGAFNTSGHFLKFQVPKEIGTVYNTMLRLQVLNAQKDSATPPAPVNVAAPVTPFWIKSIEIRIDSQIIETLFPHDIHNETLGFLNYDQLGAVQQTVNASGSDYVSGRDLLPGLNYRYLPFNNCVTTARLYNKGFKKNLEFWVYFQDGVFGDKNVTLKECTLVVEEDIQTTAADNKAWLDAGNATLVYNTIVRQRQRTNVSRTAGSTDNVDLNAISGNSAGLIVYSNTGVQANGSNNAALTARFPIEELEITYKAGGKRTETLRGEWLQAYSWTDNVKTAFASVVPTYLIPFCADFRAAVENGANTGSIAFSNKSQCYVVLGKAAETRDENIIVTNYVYSQIVISDGDFTAVTQ